MSRFRQALLVAASCGAMLCAGANGASAASELSAAQAEQRFAQAEAFERSHDLRSAFEAYSQAGEAGHPMAQKKLGDFYSAGNVAVTRDYEAALKWYQKAREQGVEIPTPPTYPPNPIDAWRR